MDRQRGAHMRIKLPENLKNVHAPKPTYPVGAIVMVAGAGGGLSGPGGSLMSFHAYLCVCSETHFTPQKSRIWQLFSTSFGGSRGKSIQSKISVS